MSNGTGEQYRFDEQGRLEPTEDEDDDEIQVNDFGGPMEWYETKGDYRKDVVVSLLQNAIRRSDEIVTAWCCWELQRSGHGPSLWRRLELIAVEDLAPGSEEIRLLDRYHEKLGDENETEWRALLIAIHAGLVAARAKSNRAATILNDIFDKLAKDYVRSQQDESHEMLHEPVVPHDELEKGGRFDVSLDRHTYPGSALGRDWRHFRIHGARCSDTDDFIQAWWRRMLEYERFGYRDHQVEFSEEEIDHAVTPTSSQDDPWTCGLSEDTALDEFDTEE